MANRSSAGTTTGLLTLADITPYLSIMVLRAPGPSPSSDFQALVDFLRRSAADRGRALEASLGREIRRTREQPIDGLGVLSDFDFDDLYAVTREIRREPGWAVGSGLVDVTNDLIIALRRGNLVAVCTRVPSIDRFRKWINREAAPFRLVPPSILASTFRGTGKMVWMTGVHRRRAEKADTQALGGIDVHAFLNPIDHGSYALGAAKIDFQPEDNLAVLRDHLTVSPAKSRISWKRASYLGIFLAATGEALDMLDKALVEPDEPTPLFGDLATYETDLSRVRAAFDVRVADPDVLRADPDTDDDEVEAAELLINAVRDVRGEPDSAAAKIDVGLDDSLAGTLVLRPKEATTGFDVTVGIDGHVYSDSVLQEIKEAVERTDVLTVYYETGHAMSRGQIVRQSSSHRPFRGIGFADFTGFCVVREKPRLKPGRSLHDLIGGADDDSLFAWVVRRYRRDWLLCDDGAGEVADFLHLSNGTLTVLHLKAAGSSSPDRRIAVHKFEQVVSQAEKNIRFVADNDALVDHLAARTTGAAAWYDGERAAATEFVEQLRLRSMADKTYVVIVQPHLLRAVHDQARESIKSGRPNRDARSLMLLDDLLHTTGRTIDATCDGLTVIGSD
jgi:hypothetical protein